MVTLEQKSLGCEDAKNSTNSEAAGRIGVGSCVVRSRWREDEGAKSNDYFLEFEHLCLLGRFLTFSGATRGQDDQDTEPGRMQIRKDKPRLGSEGFAGRKLTPAEEVALQADLDEEEMDQDALEYQDQSSALFGRLGM